MACFAYIDVSQGSVATYARCGEIFDIHLTANLPRNLSVKKISVKKILKSAKNWQNYDHESVASFFGPPCSLCGRINVRAYDRTDWVTDC